MRVLVTGAKGQLGQDLMAELASRGITGIGVDVEGHGYHRRRSLQAGDFGRAAGRSYSLRRIYCSRRCGG